MPATRFAIVETDRRETVFLFEQPPDHATDTVE
jgi:hypothetical protein